MGRLHTIDSGKIGLRTVENLFLPIFSPLHGSNAELAHFHDLLDQAVDVGHVGRDRHHDIRTPYGRKHPRGQLSHFYITPMHAQHR